MAPVRAMLHECDGSHLQFVLWQALFRFAYSVERLWRRKGQQKVNPWIEAILILSGKYERFTFVHPVDKNVIVNQLCCWE